MTEFQPRDDGPPPDREGRSVLVTGAAGFIGSHLCERLLETGHHVWGVDSFDDAYPPELKRRNLSNALPNPRMHLVEGDIRDGVLLDGLFTDVSFDAVVHLAARSGIRASVEAPGLFFESNVMGSLDLLEALRRHGVDRLVLASSTAVNGEDNPLPGGARKPAEQPVSPLAVSKHAVEVISHSYHEMYGLSVHSLRFPTVFGPRQRPDLPLHSYARSMAEGRAVSVPAVDSTAIEVLYVSDVVEAIAKSLEVLGRESADGPVYGAINLPGLQAPSLSELVARLGGALGLEATLERDSTLTGEITRKAGGSSGRRSEEVLDFRAEVELDEGFGRFAEWFWTQTDVAGGAPTDGTGGPKRQEVAQGS